MLPHTRIRPLRYSSIKPRISMSTYKARRLENIRRNEGLVRGLGLQGRLVSQPESPPAVSREPPSKRRRVQALRPTRSSARIASASRTSANTEDGRPPDRSPARRHPRRKVPSSQRQGVGAATPQPESPALELQPRQDLEALRASWSAWSPSAPVPTRDNNGTYHFESHPLFTPNKSPEDIIREGSFGGSYWRPLYSRHLRTTISDDWRELPASWTSRLPVARYLASDTYDPDVNKYGVACGQSIEQWEDAGWIAHRYDVRGWFQWYCRFWMGRRCGDDERQISRWRKCVGETGRWRRTRRPRTLPLAAAGLPMQKRVEADRWSLLPTVLKKYVQNGARTVTDEDDGADERRDLSPVVHQTCHHWAWEVRQEALDQFWRDGT
ncbi:hypothetical protein F4802DRAFT_139979 [Xylaria palmicola]|nr:hypothetical protein F4802DRAFT_139979 [Xylaria palmicola]